MRRNLRVCLRVPDGQPSSGARTGEGIRSGEGYAPNADLTLERPLHKPALSWLKSATQLSDRTPARLLKRCAPSEPGRAIRTRRKAATDPLTDLRNRVLPANEAQHGIRRHPLSIGHQQPTRTNKLLCHQAIHRFTMKRIRRVIRLDDRFGEHFERTLSLPLSHHRRNVTDALISRAHRRWSRWQHQRSERAFHGRRRLSRSYRGNQECKTHEYEPGSIEIGHRDPPFCSDR